MAFAFPRSGSTDRMSRIGALVPRPSPKLCGSTVERRLLTFIIASSAFFFAYISLRVMFVEPPPPEDQGAEVAEADPDAEGRPEAVGDPESDDPGSDDPAPDDSPS